MPNNRCLNTVQGRDDPPSGGIERHLNPTESMLLLFSAKDRAPPLLCENKTPVG